MSKRICTSHGHNYESYDDRGNFPADLLICLLYCEKESAKRNVVQNNCKLKAVCPYILWVALWSRWVEKQWLLNPGLPSASISWAAYLQMVGPTVVWEELTESILPGPCVLIYWAESGTWEGKKLQLCLGRVYPFNEYWLTMMKCQVQC